MDTTAVVAEINGAIPALEAIGAAMIGLVVIVGIFAFARRMIR